MKQQLQQRLQSLKTEYEAGQKMLADLEAKQANLRDTLLRISGAIQVLEETLSEDAETTPESSSNDTTPSTVLPTEVT
jgi:predicted nuclease with TOPRIM domain